MKVGVLPLYSPNCREKLSEKSRRCLECSPTDHPKRTFRPILSSIYRPNSRPERRSYHFEDSFRARVLEIPHRPGPPAPGFSRPDPHQFPHNSFVDVLAPLRYTLHRTGYQRHSKRRGLAFQANQERLRHKTRAGVWLLPDPGFALRLRPFACLI
jgi:hypothetical protein